MFSTSASGNVTLEITEKNSFSGEHTAILWFTIKSRSTLIGDETFYISRCCWVVFWRQSVCSVDLFHSISHFMSCGKVLCIFHSHFLFSSHTPVDPFFLPSANQSTAQHFASRLMGWQYASSKTSVTSLFSKRATHSRDRSAIWRKAFTFLARRTMTSKSSSRARLLIRFDIKYRRPCHRPWRGSMASFATASRPICRPDGSLTFTRSARLRWFDSRISAFGRIWWAQ